MQAISGCLQIKCLIIFLEKVIKTYELSFRIIRFPIGSNSYEIIITNLDRNIFDVKKIKEIYHLRWGIETSFRELKYAIGLTSFHARKPDFIKTRNICAITFV